MDAVVLAGGYATRLWPITRHRPKMLLPLGDGTVIDRVFRGLEADDRIQTVYVSTNASFADEFQTFLDGAGYAKPRLSVEETTAEDEKLGVVGALAQLVEREGVDDDLLVVAGDNLISFGVAEFIDHFEQKGAPTLAAYDVGSREKAKAYGLVDLQGDRVVDFQEKPEHPKSTLVSIACYAFPEDSLRFGEYLAADNNPDEPGWYLQWLQERAAVFAFTFDEAWYDIGTPASYLEAVAWTLEGDALVAESATIVDSDIGRNVHIMDGAELVDSTIEGSVVFPESTVRQCAVSDTIVDDHANVSGLDLDGSLVGAYSSLAVGEE